MMRKVTSLHYLVVLLKYCLATENIDDSQHLPWTTSSNNPSTSFSGPLETEVQETNEQLSSKFPKTRHVFSNKELDVLREAFRVSRYLSNADKEQIVEKTGLTPKQVASWFINERQRKPRKRTEDEQYSSSFPKTTSNPFSNDQLDVLRKAFHVNRYLSSADKEEIVEKTGLTPKQVVRWFINERKRKPRKSAEDATPSSSYDQAPGQRTNYAAHTGFHVDYSIPSADSYYAGPAYQEQQSHPLSAHAPEEGGGSFAAYHAASAPHYPEQGNQGLHADPPSVHVYQTVQRQIKVRMWNDGTDHKFTLDEEDTLRDLKKLIHKEFHIAVDHQRLMLNGQTLLHKRINEVYDIQSKLPDKPPVIIYRLIHVRIKTADEEQIHRPVISPHHDKTDDLKEKLYNRKLTNIEPEMQLLVFDNKEFEYFIEASNRGMKEGSTITLYALVNAKIIFHGEEYSMKIAPRFHTIQNLKEKIKEKLHINLEPDMQLLVFDNEEIQTNLLVSNYGMQEGSIIMLYTLVDAKITFRGKEDHIKIAPRFHTVRNFKEKIYKEIIDIKPDSQSFSIGNVEFDDKDLLSEYLLEEDFTKSLRKKEISQ